MLAKSKDNSFFYEKWQHSLIALKGTDFVGVAIGSERKAEPDNHRPHDSIYVHGFAVVPEYQKQGLGKFLMQKWIDYNLAQGMLVLNSPLRLTLQTNSADWNIHVRRLYEQLGFKKIDLKPYDNRVDIVYLYQPS